MAGRRDQYLSHRFLSRRLTGTLLRTDPDTAETPLRTLSNSTVGGIVVALVAMAVAALYGVVAPGSAPSWKNGKSLIVATDTGTRYLYLGGRLHPVLNYASALLLLHSDTTPKPVRVTRSDLDKVPPGPPLGIQGAPDWVPSATRLVSGPWTVCSDPGADALGAARPAVRLYAGTAAKSARGTALASGRALLVRDTAAEEFLVWNGARLRITSEAVLTALGYASDTPLTVGAAWENAVPQGPDLAAPQLQRLGRPGRPVNGSATRVGEVFQVAAGTGTSYYVMEADGLAPITPLQEKLLLADERVIQQAYAGAAAQPLQATPAEVQSSGTSADTPAKTALPATTPSLLPTDPGSLSVCATLASAAHGTVSVSTRMVAPKTVDASGNDEGNGGMPQAASVSVPAGHGALVRVTQSADSTTGPLYLVTDQGTKYPLADSDALSDLGLSRATPAQLPQGYAALLPTGPSLNRSAASTLQRTGVNDGPS
jgi:type VII secretion protein EccB